MKNILVPISFSESSTNALCHANLIAKQNGATLSLMHCYPALEYNREYDFGKLSYDAGIKQMLLDFYKKNIKSRDRLPIKLIVSPGSFSNIISEISHNYELIVLSKKLDSLSKSNMWFNDKLFYFITISLCPVLLLPSKRDNFSFSEFKNIWHIQRRDIELDMIKPQLLNINNDSNLVTSKSLKQDNYTSALWRNIVKYNKTHDDSQLNKIYNLIESEHLDLLILVKHKTGMFEKFIKDDTFQIINQFDIPILVLQSKKA